MANKQPERDKKGALIALLFLFPAQTSTQIFNHDIGSEMSEFLADHTHPFSLGKTKIEQFGHAILHITVPQLVRSRRPTAPTVPHTEPRRLLLRIFQKDRATEPYIDRKFLKTSQFVALSKVPESAQPF